MDLIKWICEIILKEIQEIYYNFFSYFSFKIRCFKTIHERISGILFATLHVLDIPVNNKKIKQRKKLIYKI